MPATVMGALARAVQLTMLLALVCIGEGGLDQDNLDPSSNVIRTSDPPALTRLQQKGIATAEKSNNLITACSNHLWFLR